MQNRILEMYDRYVYKESFDTLIRFFVILIKSLLDVAKHLSCIRVHIVSLKIEVSIERLFFNFCRRFLIFRDIIEHRNSEREKDYNEYEFEILKRNISKSLQFFS